MDFGNKTTQARNKKNLSCEAIGNITGTFGAIIGRYERNAMMTFNEIASKIVLAFDVLLDYLAGDISLEVK